MFKFPVFYPNFQLVTISPLTQKHSIFKAMSRSQRADNTFLKSYNRLSKLAGILAINNLRFPTRSSKTTKLSIRPIHKITTVLKVCLFIFLSGTASVLVQEIQASTTMTPITAIVVSSINLFGTCILFTNLFIEFRYRLRIWSFLIGMCDFDYVVTYFDIIKVVTKTIKGLCKQYMFRKKV